MATGTELTTDQVKARITEVTPAEARAELEAGDVVLLDTREPHEHAEAHIDGSSLVPPSEVLARADEVAPERQYRRTLAPESGATSSARASTSDGGTSVPPSM